jgi:hypothetical protein
MWTRHDSGTVGAGWRPLLGCQARACLSACVGRCSGFLPMAAEVGRGTVKWIRCAVLRTRAPERQNVTRQRRSRPTSLLFLPYVLGTPIRIAASGSRNRFDLVDMMQLRWWRSLLWPPPPFNSLALGSCRHALIQHSCSHCRLATKLNVYCFSTCHDLPPGRFRGLRYARKAFGLSKSAFRYIFRVQRPLRCSSRLWLPLLCYCSRPVWSLFIRASFLSLGYSAATVQEPEQAGARPKRSKA